MAAVSQSLTQQALIFEPVFDNILQFFEHEFILFG